MQHEREGENIKSASRSTLSPVEDVLLGTERRG
jgi:hypothetical protein